MSKKLTNENIALLLERQSGRTADVRAFGERIIQNALLDAAKEFRGGSKDKRSVVFETTVAVSVRARDIPFPDDFPLPGGLPIGPYSLDAEICMSKGKKPYACIAVPDLVIPHETSTCEILRRRYRETRSIIERMNLVLQMLRNGCLKLEAVRLSVDGI